MTAASRFIAQLRIKRVSLRLEGTRLLVEAPSGVITPDLREQLARLKPEILSELEAEVLTSTPDATTARAIRDIAPLLATAYRRSVGAGIRHSSPTNSVDFELANAGTKSVHGGVL